MTDAPTSRESSPEVPHSLIGREAELAALEACVATASNGRGRALVVVGDGGIGKSSLLDHVAASAGAAGHCRVIRVSGSRAETDITWAGLLEVCRPVIGHRGDLPARQRDGLSAALGLSAPPSPVLDPMTVGLASLQLLAAAAEHAPVVVLVDDAQWLDSASLTTLGFVGRRLEAEGVALVLACGPRLVSELDGIEELTVGPLERPSALRLLTERVGAVRADIADRLVDAAVGNPLALCELGDRLTPAQLRGEEELPGFLPLGPVLESTYARVTDDLPEATRSALLVAAASKTDSLAHVAAALGSVDLDIADLEPAEPALVTFGEGRVRFAHPLARAGVYQRARPSDRRRAHRAHAEALAGGQDQERRAWHLAAAAVDTDADVADALAEVGRSALVRGAPATASRAWAEAARLSPDPARRAEYLVDAAAGAVRAGAATSAVQLSERALATAGDPVLRARAAQLQARAERLNGAAGRRSDALTSVAATVREIDPVLSVSILLDAAASAVAGARPAAALAAARAASALCESDERCSEAFGTECAVALGAARVAAGDPAGGLALLARHADLDVDGWDPFVTDGLLQATALMLVWAEDFVTARQVLQHLIETGPRRPRVLPEAYLVLSMLEFRTGNWHAAADAAINAIDIGKATSQTALQAPAFLSLALVRACQGREEAESLVVRALELVEGRRAHHSRRNAAVVRANLALALHRPAEAIAQLEAFAGEEPDPNPAAGLWSRDLIEAQILAGRLEDAATGLDRFERIAEAVGSPRACSVAARLRGMLDPDHTAGMEHFARSQELAGSSLTFTTAINDLRWGCRLIDAGEADAARDHLEGAWRLFVDLDAPGWLAQTARALEAAGAGAVPLPPAPALRDDERALTRALAEGATVHQLADVLLVSTRTVEDRLGAALAKLGSSSRDELHRAPGRPEVAGSRTTCSLLGRFELRRGSEDLTPPPGILATAVQLVALRGQLHLEELIEELWPGAPPGRGRTRLRNVLARIRRSSGEVVRRRGEILELDPDIEVDVNQFEASAARGIGGDAAAVADALERYRGDLLPDGIYLAWAAAPRERFRRLHLDVLDAATRVAEADGRVDVAIRHLEAAIVAEPYDESRYLHLARLLADEGRTGVAVAVLERACTCLEELGLSSSPALQELDRHLRDQRAS